LKVNRHSTSYTRSVQSLLKNIQGPGNTQTLYAHAREYFAHADEDKAKLESINERIVSAKGKLKNTSYAVRKTQTGKIEMLMFSLQDERLRQDELRLMRLDKATEVCLEILSLSEGKDFEDTAYKSAKFLGTILLLSPSQGKTLSELHQRMKPAYKAVLSLRLLDKLMLDELIKKPYVLEHYDVRKRYGSSEGISVGMTQTILLPIMMAAIFQDIGLEHPDSLALLKGDDNQDVFRPLEAEELPIITKLNYKNTQDYIANGLGCQKYLGNSNEQQKKFEQQEKTRLRFQQGLIKDAVVSRQSFGDIIKIPQVYASVVLSTKRNYQRKDLPKAALLIEQLAENKTVNHQAARAFLSVVGYFPQGYGICYIAKDIRGGEVDGYEYAIVNSLYPIDPKEPTCRKVSRHLRYVSPAGVDVIEQEYNLHFDPSRKKLSKLDKNRLLEVMHKLVHKFDPADAANLIPAYWEPYEYFTQKINQNLWNQLNQLN
jgi:hypothetical protein